MPNIWTHIVFGETLLEEVGRSLDSEVAIRADEMTFYRLGTQGPDPFFYHRFWPWMKSEVPAIGLKIHYEECGPFLMKMIQLGSTRDDSKVKAYILGFITHHLLDRNTHPYIIYRSGNEGYKHQLLETTIDTILLERVRNLKTWKSRVYQQIVVGKELYSPIEDLMKEVIRTFFPEQVEHVDASFINDSYKDMIRALKIFYDPTGWKNKLLGGKIAPFSHRKTFPERDYLNEKKAPWLHPTNDQESCKQSFFELFDQALEEGKTILPLVIRFWGNKDATLLRDIKAAIGNVSYDTGKDCRMRVESRFFEPIV